jgi:hypothetical protein
MNILAAEELLDEILCMSSGNLSLSLVINACTIDRQLIAVLGEP